MITVVCVWVERDFAHLGLRCSYCASMCMWRSAQPTGSPVIPSAFSQSCAVSFGDISGAHVCDQEITENHLCFFVRKFSKLTENPSSVDAV